MLWATSAARRCAAWAPNYSVGTINTDYDALDRADYPAAAQYLAKSPTHTANMKTVAASKQVYTLVIDPAAKGASYLSETKTVTYNPTEAARLNDGSVQSAALSLAHEIGHAAQDERNPQQYQQDNVAQVISTEQTETGISTTYARKPEERRMTAEESTIARELGEPTRSSHSDGVAERVSDPTYSCRASEATKC